MTAPALTPAPAAPPAVTVVVPTYGRPAKLRACLRALMDLHDPPGGYEVGVVDDGGPDDLAPIVREADPTGTRVHLHRQDNAGPARARNAGARVARGGLLAFTDDDCRPEPGWLVALAAAHARHPDALLGGHTWNERPDNLCAQASQDLLAFLYRDQQRRNGDAPFFASNNLAVSAERFADLGGFDETFPLAAGEDREFCDRFHHAFAASAADAPAAAAGPPPRALRFVSDAVVRHAHAMTPAQFWRQHRNYGRGALHFAAARARHGRPGLSTEGPRFYGGMLTEPWRTGPHHGRLRRAALIFLSQAGTASGYAAERRRSPRPAAG